jgi:hypothetical protein
MTPAAQKVETEKPDRWVYSYNFLVIYLEYSKEKFAKIEADWRISFTPNLSDRSKHMVRLTLIARHPDEWSQPAVVQDIGVTDEEMETLNTEENISRLFELVAARVEVGFRSLIQTLFEHNPEQQQRISGYV